MRLPLYKTFRAFPELDRFSDSECTRLISEIRSTRSFIGGVVNALASFVLLGAWIVAASGIAALVARHVAEPRNDVLFDTVFGIVMAATLLCGMVGVAVLADYRLRRALRRRLTSARCPSCGYSLLGLPVAEGDVVTCPECGRRTDLSSVGLTAAGILSRTQ